MNKLLCRFCGHPLSRTFVDLGVSPLANAYVKRDAVLQMERFYPLHVFVCEHCLLVQLPQLQTPQEIFDDYAYFSSYSDTWLKHARDYTELMIGQFGFDSASQVIEIASNDGYLLQYFKEKGIPVLGIEPAANVAKAAQDAGITTVVRYFGQETAMALSADGRMADLLIGNNVLAHVPDLNDFVAGMKTVLKPKGIITMEFPHLMRLMEDNQFDTIYHEHFSYFSFLTVSDVFSKHGLKIFDVEELATHGGSLRIFACRAEDHARTLSQRAKAMIEKERAAGLRDMATYLSFQERVKETKRNILAFLVQAKNERKAVVGYGAPAKGNTLLNYCGIRTDFIEYTVDRSPHKQGHFLPGTRIPIYGPERIAETQPDYLIILPWNLLDEIMGQMAHIRQWGGRFVTLIPDVRVYP